MTDLTSLSLQHCSAGGGAGGGGGSPGSGANIHLGGNGGNAYGGGLYATGATIILNAAPVVEFCQADAGAGGVGGAGGPFGQEGSGGNGGNAYGGGLDSSAGGAKVTFSLQNATLQFDNATGGPGGNQGAGTLPAGSGGNGGNASGGAAYVDDSASSIVYIDLNGMKAINDRWGHNIGYAALQHVARLLVENTRHSDIVARLGLALPRSRLSAPSCPRAVSHRKPLSMSMRIPSGGCIVGWSDACSSSTDNAASK